MVFQESSPCSKFMYLITDGGSLRRSGLLVDRIRLALKYANNSIAAIHIREKISEDSDAFSELDELLIAIKQATQASEIKLFLHGSIEHAIKHKLDGVQLGLGSFNEENIERIAKADLCFAYSAHSLAELEIAKHELCSHVFLSPIFKPISKPDDSRAPVGLDLLRQGCLISPVVALGGMQPERAKQCRLAGARGIATLSGVLPKKDIKESIEEFEKAWGV